MKYLQRMDGSDEVVVIITSLRVAKGESIMIRGFTKKVKNDNEVKVSRPQPIALSAVPQQPVVSLKIIPWNYE